MHDDEYTIKEIVEDVLAAVAMVILCGAVLFVGMVW